VISRFLIFTILNLFCRWIFISVFLCHIWRRYFAVLSLQQKFRYSAYLEWKFLCYFIFCFWLFVVKGFWGFLQTHLPIVWFCYGMNEASISRVLLTKLVYFLRKHYSFATVIIWPIWLDPTSFQPIINDHRFLILIDYCL